MSSLVWELCGLFVGFGMALMSLILILKAIY